MVISSSYYELSWILTVVGKMDLQMGITCSPLPQNNGNLPLTFFGGN